ncbi:uncharacterized protein N7482_001755 [Penicillium canariense]|uniref:Mitotic checkpoint regulator, MAD2B-interacting-domain-containing protein n=1 Tax=Penicillium canariense TaxID=189055 RepID=A0A9W9LT90_9EURO|nr:uncharacterized protein N7482_001755 [Penicillium canariense]KAJ5175878.1 hypothetical protein N7482_001755 [Penicillium canariense]
MALVAYSDSEGSDAEPDTTPAPSVAKPKPEAGAGFQVDRGNPRKIRVALPLKPEHPTDQDAEDGPARKKARLGAAAGGAFAGFNSFLPAPKRAVEKKAQVATTRKVFSLKTGAEPGFDRTADAEMRNSQAFNHNADATDSTIPTPGSLGQPAANSDNVPVAKAEAGVVKLQGNPMMFRPLSVARNQKKKQTTKVASQPIPSAAAASVASKLADPTAQQPTASASAPAPAPMPPKPKVSLFSLSSEDTAPTDDASAPTGIYEPLVYNTETETEMEAASADAALVPESIPTDAAYYPTNASVSSSLDTIANDLNLSKSERRQLFGRNAPSAQSRILSFNTDKEYASNQANAETELAATQHNPVRAIAPGKHTLQQLVNAASTQKDALEESFATGRRNKKEAGSKYGW